MSHSDVSVCVWTSNFWKTTSCFCCIWLQTSISNPSLLLSFDILFFVNLFLPKKSIHIFRCVVALLLAIKKLEMNREGVSLGFHINTRIFSQMNFFLCVKISLWRIEFRISGTLFFFKDAFQLGLLLQNLSTNGNFFSYLYMQRIWIYVNALICWPFK